MLCMGEGCQVGRGLSSGERVVKWGEGCQVGRGLSSGERVVKWGGGLHYKHTNLERETITLEHVSSVLFKNSSTVMESSSGSSHRQVELISSSTASIRQSRISVTYTTDNAQIASAR